MHSTTDVLKFIFILTSVVALGLTGLREATKGRADANEAIFNKKGVLLSIQGHFAEKGDSEKVKDWDNKKVEEIYNSKIKGYVFDSKGNQVEGKLAIDLEKDRDKNNKLSVEERLFPVWVFKDEGKTYYVVAVYGKGLWDKIWGCVALEDDFNTLAGAGFDHKGETPGLGAEIKDNAAFPRSFRGRKIYAADGTYMSVNVRKGGAKDITHEVDGISGATITANGVSAMFYEGFQLYEPVLKAVKEMKL